MTDDDRARGEAATAPEIARLAAAIDDGIDEARRRWGVAVDREAVERWIFDRPEPSPQTALHHTAEIALCVACAAGSDQAIERFVAEYFDEVPRALGRSASAIAQDDAAQRLRERLFVADGHPPRVTHYAGHGKLRAWVRVVAMRVVTDLARERGAGVQTRTLDADAPIAASGDLELDYLKGRYAEVFREAFGVAVARLDVRQRNLLRHQLLHGATYETIAALYRVSRATCARWLAQARIELVEGVRAEMRARLGLGETELEELLALVRSRIDLSLHAQLRTAVPAVERG